MFMDNSISFTGIGTPAAISSSGNAANLYDITGAGSGNAPAMTGGTVGNTALGADMGLGDGEASPWVFINVTTAGTGSGTIQFELAAAPDNGSYAPGTYTPLGYTNAFVGSSLVAGSIIAFRLPPTAPLAVPGGEALPRFYRLSWVVSGTATVSVEASLVLNPPSSLIASQYPSNFIAV